MLLYMFRIIKKSTLKNLMEDSENSRLELIAIYGNKKYDRADPCQLCLKRLGLNIHHLVPRKKRAEAARKLAEQQGIAQKKALLQIRARKIRVCRHCHNILHFFYTDEDLANFGDTFDKVVALYKVAADKAKLNLTKAEKRIIKKKIQRKIGKRIDFRRKVCYYWSMIIRFLKKIFGRQPLDVCTPDDDRHDRRCKGWDELRNLNMAGYAIKDLNRGFQFRVNDRLDVYPTNKKWHDTYTGKRGTYETVYDFVVHFFKKHGKE